MANLTTEALEREERRKARANWPVRVGSVAEVERDDEGIVGDTIAERWEIVWDLTVNCAAMRGEDLREQGLQRDVVRLYRGGRRVSCGRSVRPGGLREHQGNR